MMSPRASRPPRLRAAANPRLACSAIVTGQRPLTAAKTCAVPSVEPSTTTTISTSPSYSSCPSAPTTSHTSSRRW
jgi:hypothetical protein